jgi:hypothetical protein
MIIHQFLVVQRVLDIFVKNACDCEVVDPYNARKRYAVIEKVRIG